VWESVDVRGIRPTHGEWRGTQKLTSHSPSAGMERLMRSRWSRGDAGAHGDAADRRAIGDGTGAREFVLRFWGLGYVMILDSRFVYRIRERSSPGLVKGSLGCRDPSWLTETSRYMHKQYRGPL